MNSKNIKWVQESMYKIYGSLVDVTVMGSDSLRIIHDEMPIRLFFELTCSWLSFVGYSRIEGTEYKLVRIGATLKWVKLDGGTIGVVYEKVHGKTKSIITVIVHDDWLEVMPTDTKFLQ